MTLLAAQVAGKAVAAQTAAVVPAAAAWATEDALETVGRQAAPGEGSAAALVELAAASMV